MRIKRAHDVRFLSPCPKCRDIGDSRQMVTDPLGAPAGTYHPRCLLDVIGFDGVLRLPPTDRGRFTFADLGLEQARQLLESMEAPFSDGDVLHAI